MIVLHWTDQSAFQSRPSAKTIVVSAVFQLLQVVWIAISSYRMVYFIIHDVVAPGVFVNMYAFLAHVHLVSDFALGLFSNISTWPILTPLFFESLPGTWPT